MHDAIGEGIKLLAAMKWIDVDMITNRQTLSTGEMASEGTVDDTSTCARIISIVPSMKSPAHACGFLGSFFHQYRI